MEKEQKEQKEQKKILYKTSEMGGSYKKAERVLRTFRLQVCNKKNNFEKIIAACKLSPVRISKELGNFIDYCIKDIKNNKKENIDNLVLKEVYTEQASHRKKRKYKHKRIKILMKRFVRIVTKWEIKK